VVIVIIAVGRDEKTNWGHFAAPSPPRPGRPTVLDLVDQRRDESPWSQPHHPGNQGCQITTVCQSVKYGVHGNDEPGLMLLDTGG
jgi:hypothetical protein